MVKFPPEKEIQEELKITIIGDQKIPAGLSITVEVTFMPRLSYDKHKTDRRYEIELTSRSSDYCHSVPIIRK